MIMGLYQCRGDISNTDCYSYVCKIPDMIDKLCGKVVAARVHLIGCYLRYEVVGFKQVPETQLLYKVGRSKKESYDDDGFEERRDSAFGMVESGVRNGANLFYAGSSQSLYVLGHCEGDLANDDCGDCVKSAVDQAKVECGDSISAKIYLHKCFINYSFYSKRGSNMLSSPGLGRRMRTFFVEDLHLTVVVVCIMLIHGIFIKLGSCA